MAYIIQLLVTAIISGYAKQMVNVGIISAVYVLIDSYMDYAVEIVNERLTQAVILDIRQDVLKGISHLTVKGFYQEPDEYYMNLLTNDMDVVDEEYLKELLSMYNDICIRSGIFLDSESFLQFNHDFDEPCPYCTT